MEEKKIYSALVGVMSDIGAIGKEKKNAAQGFMYRGIDDVMNSLQPALVKNKVLVIPSVLNEEREERTTTKGGTMFAVRLTMRFDFTAVDGSCVPVTVIGEAMDSGDKATNKAMSIAYKYACFQTLCIPTEEMKNADPDAYIPEPSVKKETPKKAEPKKAEPKKQVEINEQDSVIDELKVKALVTTMARKGVTNEMVFQRLKVNDLHEITVTQYISLCKMLEKTPDKPQDDLGF